MLILKKANVSNYNNVKMFKCKALEEHDFELGSKKIKLIPQISGFSKRRSSNMFQILILFL